ncbi:hypothetical protein D7X94_04905 [Acutalibacter sp. 1XD8-33]|uniref:hypothetical protein n=1 Tax=Acutalibacter sp. 1XD8-33 TaxID=2320081 RepID=UPI000EA28B2A|nr:hypothetical protein [Acutalibacter sp. 1XD8-33]RKJ41145.1 hypothetical protein D7X94_04905 [Acutalibacter sp. 1XD8-33]
MDETFHEFQIRYEEKSLKAAELAKKAAEMTHTVFTANQKSQKAFTAINSHDKAVMWNTLQEFCGNIPVLSIILRLSQACVYIPLTANSTIKSPLRT